MFAKHLELVIREVIVDFNHNILLWVIDFPGLCDLIEGEARQARQCPLQLGVVDAAESELPGSIACRADDVFT
jgi:hypothetical protein